MRIIQFLILTLLFFSISICCNNPSNFSNNSPNDINNQLKEIQDRVYFLGNDIFKFWLKNGPDKLNGGFYGTLDKNGKPISPNNKGIIAMSRHLWGFSTWYELKEQTPEVKKICDDLYHYIIEHFYDPVTNEFFWMVDEKGKVIDQKKPLYAESFAIYGLAQYAKVFNNSEATIYALNCFKAIDKRAHDSNHGGYDQTNETDWIIQGAEKETNTHIHILESFTILYELTNDSLVKERLEEMLHIVTFKIVQPEGYAHLQFNKDWSLVGDNTVSYGHDIETCWLLYEAAKVLNKENDSLILNQIIKLGTHSANEGFDEKNGGYFDHGIPGIKVTDSTKVWWIQSESLSGLLRLYILTKNEIWLDKLQKTLNWIEQSQIDKNTGEWYWDINAKGKTVTTSNLGNEWKTCYHNLRSCIFIEKWINFELFNN